MRHAESGRLHKGTKRTIHWQHVQNSKVQFMSQQTRSGFYWAWQAETSGATTQPDCQQVIMKALLLLLHYRNLNISLSFTVSSVNCYVYLFVVYFSCMNNTCCMYRCLLAVYKATEEDKMLWINDERCSLHLFFLLLSFWLQCVFLTTRGQQSIVETWLVDFM